VLLGLEPSIKKAGGGARFGCFLAEKEKTQKETYIIHTFQLGTNAEKNVKKREIGA